MTNNKLVLASFVAFAMLAMVATTIVTQETYAAHKHGRIFVGGAGLGDGYCGTNWQGSITSEFRESFSEYTGWNVHA